MGDHRSPAVMQQRATSVADELDYFPTPPWAVRAICEILEQRLGTDLRRLSVWEPACGEMHMAKPLAEYFGHVRASDVIQYRPEHALIDFSPLGTVDQPPADVIFTNPPFNLGPEFIDLALQKSRQAVVMLVRSAFAEGEERYDEIYSIRPPALELVFVERVVMLKGRLIRAGAIDPFAAKPGTKASTATAYAAMVWIKGQPASGDDCRKVWIPKCRLRLERPGDYPDYATEGPTKFRSLISDYAPDRAESAALPFGSGDQGGAFH